MTKNRHYPTYFLFGTLLLYVVLYLLPGILGIGIAHERQVGHEKAAGSATTGAAGVVGHFFHGHGQGGIVPLQDHAQGIAHEYDLYAGFHENSGKTGVVGRDRGEFFAGGLPGAQIRDGGGFLHMAV